MPVTYRVMVSGFDDAGRHALEPCFAARSLIAYVSAEDLPQADLVVVASDDEAACSHALQLLQPNRVLFVGLNRPAGARWHVPLPLDARVVLARLDELVATEKPAPHAFTDPFLSLLKPAAGGLSFAGFGDRARQALAPRAAELSEPPRTRSGRASVFPEVPAVSLSPDDMAPEAPRAPSRLPPPERPAKATMRAAVRRALRGAEVARAPVIDTALIVESHAPHRLLLADLLGSFGFQPMSATTIEQAERQLAERAFGVVFLGLIDDPEGEVAGIELCHRLKQRTLPLPSDRPRVVMVWSRPRPADHVRARLAGCDHFITGPIGRGPVARALEAMGVPLPADPRGQGRAGEAPGDPVQLRVSTTGA